MNTHTHTHMCTHTHICDFFSLGKFVRLKGSKAEEKSVDAIASAGLVQHRLPYWGGSHKFAAAPSWSNSGAFPRLSIRVSWSLLTLWLCRCDPQGPREARGHRGGMLKGLEGCLGQKPNVTYGFGFPHFGFGWSQTLVSAWSSGTILWPTAI